MRKSLACIFTLAALAIFLVPIDAAFAQAGTSMKCQDGTTVHVTVEGGSCTTSKGPRGNEIYCKNDSTSSSAFGGCDDNGKAYCSANAYGTADCSMKSAIGPGGNSSSPKGSAAGKPPASVGAKSLNSGGGSGGTPLKGQTALPPAAGAAQTPSALSNPNLLGGGGAGVTTSSKIKSPSTDPTMPTR